MELIRNFRHLARLSLPGGGQVTVQGGTAYVGHMEPPHGTSLIDISDPRNPKVLSTIMLEGDGSHSHKVRVVGDLMFTNVEQNDRHAVRRGQQLAAAEAKLAASLGRPPTDAEIAGELRIPARLIPKVRALLADPYTDGGFRIWDVSDPRRPRQIVHQRTHGFGVHRFDVDARYAYMSTEAEGFIGNILIVYDLADPAHPTEVSRWWMPGQHLAGGEVPTWRGYRNRLHHAMRFGDELWAAVMHAGIRVIDASDITNLRTVGSFDYHPPFPCPTHTVVPVPVTHGGRRVAVAVDEEHDHVPGELHGGLWFLDVEDRSDIRPISMFHLSELASPWPAKGERFGAHQFQEYVKGHHLFCAWFSGGLRMIDIADPARPTETGWFIPEPAPGQTSPQSNDVFQDDRGLVYVVDRNDGLDILEPLV